ncbi:MAG: hypothetical protein E7649_05555 [Ruminococcaceae bacterium]|nr:hypothetical protein [Oscillospiraceae bacterium]
MQQFDNSIDQVHIAAGSYGEAGDFFGAHKRGANVVFRYFDPFADRVFVVGSFNGWGESVRMRRDKDGIWTAKVKISDCPMESLYKYKVYEGDDTRYVTDPYSEKTDGSHYHNSVVCNSDGYVWGDGAFLENSAFVYGNGFDNEPFYVYEMSIEGWCAKHMGESATYESVARELSVYAKQMRYTHVLLNDVFARYFDADRAKHSVVYYAPNTRFGDSYCFRRFVDIMHKANVGVIINCHFGSDADIYLKRELYSGTVLYWISNYHIDGVALTARNDMEAKMALELSLQAKALRPDIALIVNGGFGNLLVDSNCIPRCVESERALLRYFVGGFDDRCAGGLCQCAPDGRELVSGFEKYCTDELLGDEWRVFAGARAIASCLMTLCCKKAIFMGAEIGMGEKTFGGCVEWSLLEHDFNAGLQLCYADLGELYLSCPSLWRNSNFSFIDESASDRGVVSFERDLGEERLSVIVNLSVNVYENHKLGVLRDGTYDEVFNSDSLCYGGSGVVNGKGISSTRIGTSGAIIQIKVPPLAVAVFRLRDK